MKKSNLRYGFYNMGVNLPILSAVIGALLSVIILFNSRSSEQPALHNLSIENPQSLISGVIQKRIDSAKNKIARLSKILDTAKTEALRKSFDDTINVLQAITANAISEKNNLKHFNIDSSYKYFHRYFANDRKALRKAIESLSYAPSQTIPINIRDSFSNASHLYTYPIFNDTILIIKTNNVPVVKFIDANPVSGLWFFVTVAQMAMWFLFAVLITGAVIRTNNVVSELSYNLSNALFFLLLPAFVIGLFAWLLYFRLAEEDIIHDAYFMNNFTSKVGIYSVFGYTAATLCFSVYLFLSNKLELLNWQLTSTQTKLIKDPDLVSQYQSLKLVFDLAFLLTAVILSVFVFWMGLLYHSANNLEIMQWYNSLTGINVISYDYVYLAGLLHSFLLLIFYIPVKIRFDALEIKQQDDTLKTAGTSNKYLKSLWESLGTLLITASPVITTILQKLISNLIGE